jgi:hypothetical protein
LRSSHPDWCVGPNILCRGDFPRPVRVSKTAKSPMFLGLSRCFSRATALHLEGCRDAF